MDSDSELGLESQKHENVGVNHNGVGVNTFFCERSLDLFFPLRAVESENPHAPAIRDEVIWLEAGKRGTGETWSLPVRYGRNPAWRRRR